MRNRDTSKINELTNERIRHSLRIIIISVFSAPTMGMLLQCQAREWVDATGKFRVEAEFVEVKDGVVKLRKPDGTSISIPQLKLSQSDRDHIAKLTESPPSPSNSEAHVEQSAKLDHIDRALSRIGALGNTELRREIEIRQSQLPGYVAIGKIELPLGYDFNQVLCQQGYLKDGFFVGAVKSPGIPIYFWLPGHARLDLVPEYVENTSTDRKTTVLVLSKARFIPLDESYRRISGRLVSSSGIVPSQLTGIVKYKLPVMNANVRQDLLKILLKKLIDQERNEKLTIDPHTGDFLLTDFAELPFELNFSSDEKESFIQNFDYHPNGTADLGEVVMHIGNNEQSRKWAALNNQTSPIPENPDPTLSLPASNPDVEVAKILKELQPDNSARKFFEERLNSKLKEQQLWIRQGKPAVVVVGKIGLPNPLLNPHEILAQMPIHPTGYFCDLAVPGLPIGFRLHGFDPLNYVPRDATSYPIDYAGDLQMVPTKPSDMGTLTGSVMIEENATVSIKTKSPKTTSKKNQGDQASSPSITATAKREMYSRLDNSEGYSPIIFPIKNHAPTPKAIFDDNRFILSNLSPITHYLVVTAPGMSSQLWTINLAPGETRERLPFQLYRKREVKMTCLVSDEADFSGAKPFVISTGSIQGSVVDFGKQLISRKKKLDITVQFFQHGNSVGIKLFNQPSYLTCLGKVDLEACRLIEKLDLKDSDHEGSYMTLQEGNVYYMQLITGYRVLFKVMEIR